MGDELRYLQAEMQDVIRRSQSAVDGLKIRTGALVYRDHTDEYVTRISRLTDDISATQKFISEQHAMGGGDYEEAIPEALMASFNAAGWSEEARARIAFLVLDAPCHQDSVTLRLLHEQVFNAAAQGIRLVPVVCSGLRESGELLMRSLALFTNGTSFFLTDDSGIGNSHLKPTTDSLRVEHLNDMLVRTIISFTSMPDCNVEQWSEEAIEEQETDRFIPDPFRVEDLDTVPERLPDMPLSEVLNVRPNPYISLPKMVMLTYQLPDQIREIAEQGEFNEFDLNEFFRADDSQFAHEEYVQKWVDLIHGSYVENVVSDLKLSKEKPPMPFTDARLLDYLRHTYWFLPSVASCKAMKKLLEKPTNKKFFGRYNIIIAAGNEAGMGAEAVIPVYAHMGNPQEDCTITLSCGKLSTGVTVKPWTGIFMLRNSSSPETYFQAAFRVQSPWTTRNEWGEEIVLKPLCYVFDFAPNRALRQVAEYSCRLSVNEQNPEQKVADFIHFLPILAYDGSSMKQIDAAGILDMAMSGTTATLLARRWESALLVNVDNATLSRLLASQEAMNALMNIEAFRGLNSDIETIINKSEAVKKTKKERGEDLTPKEKKELTAEEKEYKAKRRAIQEKLIKFATRIPVFMYLTDYREYTLNDVIYQLEPELFRKVTGLTLQDFDLLVSLGVFNRELMNDAVYKFKRYEDSSLIYTGINTHEGENVGGFDTVISEQTYKNQIIVADLSSAPVFAPAPADTDDSDTTAS